MSMRVTITNAHKTMDRVERNAQAKYKNKAWAEPNADRSRRHKKRSNGEQSSL